MVYLINVIFRCSLNLSTIISFSNYPFLIPVLTVGPAVDVIETPRISFLKSI